MNDKKYLTVTALTKYIKYKIDNDVNLQDVYLKGEISNFKAHTRGHYYFTIKDETSRISAIMFNYKTSNIKFIPEDGMNMLFHGKISVFESTGNYQIYVDEMLEDGVGALYIAYEQLKKKLSEEGLFDLEHKQAIPKIPSRVGIITASTGAAIKDILSTIKRRFPICETILFPTLVQGELAKDDIVKKLKVADTYNLDVIILGRGGGSIEDLWPFNEEIVARAVYNAKTPIISAVGHEIDFTICDYVADLRAETPTAAAVLAVPDINKLIKDINNYMIRVNESIKSNIKYSKLRITKLLQSKMLKDPMSIYEIKEQLLDNYFDKLISYIKSILYFNNQRLVNIKNNYIFKNPDIIFEPKNNKINLYLEKITILNPLNSLKRGYAIIYKDDKVVSTKEKIKKEDILNIKIKDGNIISKVMEVENGKK